MFIAIHLNILEHLLELKIRWNDSNCNRTVIYSQRVIAQSFEDFVSWKTIIAQAFEKYVYNYIYHGKIPSIAQTLENKFYQKNYCTNKLSFT